MSLPSVITSACSALPRGAVAARELDHLRALGGGFHAVAVDADHRRARPPPTTISAAASAASKTAVNLALIVAAA